MTKRTWMKNRRKIAREQGICVSCLKNSIYKTAVQCKKCLDYATLYHKAFIKRGLCGTCHKNIPVNNRITCKKCLGYYRAYFRNIRKTIVDAFENQYCRCCGETNLSFFTIAHVNNDGARDRKNRGGCQQINRYLFNLIQQGKQIPKEYIIECWNCNSGKRYNNNICPHISPVVLSNLSHRARLHKRVIQKYGDICSKCGENNIGFLTIEHINGGGQREIREKFKGENCTFYRYLLKTDKRKDITVLCYNCNCTKRKE